MHYPKHYPGKDQIQLCCFLAVTETVTGDMQHYLEPIRGEHFVFYFVGIVYVCRLEKISVLICGH